jgi:hypothetical protein
MPEGIKMEKLFTYTVYAFVIMAVGLVVLVGWDFTHGG